MRVWKDGLFLESGSSTMLLAAVKQRFNQLIREGCSAGLPCLDEDDPDFIGITEHQLIAAVSEKMSTADPDELVSLDVAWAYFCGRYYFE